MGRSYPHERRLFALLPDVDREVLVRVKRYVDGVMVPTERSALGALWRPIADDVCDRVVLIEHFAGTVSRGEYRSAITKVNEFISKHWKMSSERPLRPPILVIIAHKSARAILWSFEETGTPGIYSCSHVVEHILIVATQLPPDDDTLTPLRLCTRVPKDEATEVEFVQYLRADKHLSTLEKERLMEQIMENARVNFSETFQEMCERFVQEMQTEPRYQTMMAELAELKAHQARLEEGRQRAEEERQRAEEERQRAEARLVEERRQREVDRARYEQDIADLRRRLADDPKDG